MIEDLLEQISNNSSVDSCGIFDLNGLLIVSNGNKDHLDKISNSMHRILDENSKQFLSLDIEPINCITLIGEKGMTLFWPLKESAALALKVDSDANLGMIRKQINELIPRIESLI
ncbi:MAG: hypothetical protein CMA03_05445 [Euryarchaeota archaeon]|nr:hypothetical protein [Euryarchaeota archaeon]|tara:strand:+ start:1730 stop:2074 length:345 start_codon:yes stop_codon:yes gene_type:complete